MATFHHGNYHILSILSHPNFVSLTSLKLESVIKLMMHHCLIASIFLYSGTENQCSILQSSRLKFKS